ncbi:hypothetical protein [Bradyrhizobium erythrophlei]|nr:hypothetical protein [Bradyrhizobium erythrophlei]
MTESYSQIYALYEIRVIDGKTFDVIEPSRPVDGNFPMATMRACTGRLSTSLRAACRRRWATCISRLSADTNQQAGRTALETSMFDRYWFLLAVLLGVAVIFLVSLSLIIYA